MSSQILLYSGMGASSFCLNAIERQLNELTDNKKYQINKVDDLTDRFNDPHSIKAIVVPGGHAGFMFFSMKDTAALIKKTIETYNIPYMGICAGSILASSGCYEQWKVNDHTISIHDIEEHYLNIFPGKVVAPIFPKPKNGVITFEDFRPLEITVSKTNSLVQSSHILSPAFLDCNLNQDMEILSTYDHQFFYEVVQTPCFRQGRTKMEPSIISPDRLTETVLYKRNGLTPVLLSGTHLEIDSTAINSNEFKEAFPNYKDLPELIHSFEISDAARKALLQRNFELIGLDCKD